MKSRIWASLLIACLPWLAMAQSNDDLYFVPKRKRNGTEKRGTVRSEADFKQYDGVCSSGIDYRSERRYRKNS